MQCPVCDVTLSISSREGVEIDFCPQCRGVWLDRGELDKIIERAGAVLAAAQAAPAVRPDGRDEQRWAPEPRYDDRAPTGRYPDDRYRDDRYRSDRDRRDERSHDGDRYRKKRKKKGFDFLEDLFDL